MPDNVSDRVVNTIRSHLGYDIGGPSTVQADSSRHPATPPPLLNLSDVQYNKSLPVYVHRNEILNAVSGNNVTLICSQPGSGKSTQIPQYILDDCVQHSRPCNIVVTQPRRIAAISVAKWVTAQRRQPLGQICGYQVSLDKTVSNSTRLLYCTTGILLQKLIQARSLDEYSHIVLDEAHDRTKEMDFLFLLVSRFLNTVSPHTKVVIMSATLQIHEIASYFTTITSPKIINLTEHLYNVNLFYADDFDFPIVRQLTVFDAANIDRVEQQSATFLSASSVIAALRLIEKWDHDEFEANPRNFVRGTVLVFLPGMGEIIEIDNQISQHFPESSRFVVLPLHSEIAISDQIVVFEKHNPRERRIILATNIAESSITVPDVRYVIDCCMTKQLQCDPCHSFTSLQLTWASKSNCEQRKGRAGRVANGVCIRLVPRDFYESLPKTERPEMLRTPLLNVILQTKLLGLGSPWDILQGVISPPEKSRVLSNVLTLFELGALTVDKDLAAKTNFSDGDLTFVGQIMARLPISVHLSKLIAIGHVLGLLEDAVIMAVVSSSRQIFPAGYRNLVRRVRNKRRWANGTNSEMFAMANIFKCYLAYTKENLLRTREEMRRFTTQNGVSIRSLLEAHRLYDDLFRRLSIMRVRPFRSNLLQEMQEAHKTNELKHNIDCLFLKVAIAGSCYPNYFVRTPLDYKTVNKSMKLYDPQRTVKVEKISPIEKNLVADTLQDTLHQDLRMTNATVVLDENDKNLFIVCEGDLNSRTIGDDTTIIIENSVQYLSDNLSHCKVHEDVITLASIDRLTIKPKSARRLIGVNMRSSRNNGYNAHIVKIIRFGRFSAKIEGQDDVHEYQMAAIGTTNDVDCKDFEEFLPSDRRVYLEPVDDEHISSLCSDPARMVEVYVDGDYRRSKLSDALIEVFPGIENRQYHTQRSIQIGPFKSNLKSSFTALPRALNISNEVRIHRSDINGHMLDCESSLDFERLVVAGEVRCNENSVCLFNTTEMPPIVGMPLMMTLIFSPVCQIRADCFRTMYVSALCGLGIHPDSGVAVYPDHDIALHFDAMFK